MQILSSLRNNLALKAEAIDRAERRLHSGPTDAVTWLRNRLRDREFVLFCGAGVSASPPSSAPTFLQLRTSLMLALADLLVREGTITQLDLIAVETALGKLDARADLSLPPELVFMWIKEALGFGKVYHLLKCCLDCGIPNANHLAVRKLLSGNGQPKISGLITPNFDLYIERALEGVPFRRTIVNDSFGQGGIHMFKPHGSLDHPETIAVTIDQILRPLKGSARQLFEELTSGRTIVVVGYSGWDYDLLPQIIRAGRETNADVIWILYDEASVNERVCAVQLALEDRCTILNARRQPVLAVLADVEDLPSRHEIEPLRSKFAEVLRNDSPDSLAAALINLLVPAGLPEAGGILVQLSEGLLRAAEHITDEQTRLDRLRDVANWAEGDRKERALRLALDSATRLGNKSAIRIYTRRLSGEDDEPRHPDARLRRLERDLEEFNYSLSNEPDPALATQTIRGEVRIEIASLLCEMGRYREAGVLAKDVLRDTWFPESSVCEKARIVDDACTIGELHTVLGCVAADTGNIEEMQSHFCASIDVPWREGQFYQLGEALLKMVSAVKGADRECARAVLQLAIGAAVFSRDRLSELVAIEWKAHYGFGIGGDIERAEELLERVGFDGGDRAQHLETIHRMRRRIG